VLALAAEFDLDEHDLVLEVLPENVIPVVTGPHPAESVPAWQTLAATPALRLPGRAVPWSTCTW
jgi:hypothetical protein